jgi:predicted DNA-binding WGR domain protein
VRRWELVSGGSAKFWEVERGGPEVAVRFGRLGAAGQAKTTTFDSEEAASAHVDKLVAEKEKKGYVETTEPIPVAAQPGATGPPVFTMPKSWWPHVHVRRGGRVRADVAVDRGAAEKVRAALTASLAELEGVLDGPESEERLVDAARAYLAGDATPLGAAAVAVLLEENPATRSVLDLVAPAWFAEHGLPFAAQAAVEAFSMQVYRTHHPEKLHVLRHIPPEGRPSGTSWPVREVMRQVRSFLAAAPEAEYEAAVAAVGALRAGLRPVVAAAYLLPSERTWVDEAYEQVGWANERTGKYALLFSIGSVAHLDRAIKTHGMWWPFHDKQVTFTVADAVGVALAPVLVPILKPDLEAYFRELVLESVVEFPTAEAFDLLLARPGEKGVLPTVLDMARRYPALALERFAATPTADALLKAHLRRYPALADQADLPEDARAFVEALRAERATLDEAPLDALPELLTAPPWAVQRTPVKPVVLKGFTAPDHRAVEWEPGEREAWAEVTYPHYNSCEDWTEEIAQHRAGTLDESRQEVMFFEGPVEELRLLLADWRPSPTWYSGLMGKAILARFGVDALPLALHLAPNRRDEMADLVLPLVSLETARFVARWPLKVKTARDISARWLRRHPAHAARFLVPDAVGPAGKERTAAEAVLRQIPDQAREAAAEYGPEVAEVVDRLLSVDPLVLLPKAIPVPGAWADPIVLPPVLLRGTGQALPAESVRHLLTVLALSTLDDVYAGVDVVRESCDPSSLARFAWELFELWRLNGMPSKDGWVLASLGLLGDDEVVRGLVPLIRAWPGEAQHARAVTGLDVLAAIGTDAALAALNSIAQRVKFAGLKNRAQEKIRDVADELGLTAEQLSDRLVPDFGLDDASSLTIDYGPRRFTVGFDENLKPFVLDEAGKRLKDLPKPGAKDDQALAPGEHKRYGRLKKDVRTIAGDQIVRLESAMVLLRRWPATEFRSLLADHPLLWHLVRRLVWTTEDGRSFRVAEDRTLADVHDDAFDLPDDALVGVAHPLHLGTAVAGWAEVFADYEILQPFQQLGRPVHRLEETERTAVVLDRFKGLQVDVGRLLGLTKRGWQRGAPMDAGFEHEITRPLPGGGEVEVGLSPGIAVSMPHEWPVQDLVDISLRAGGLTFGELDPVTTSEVLAELTSLTD